jgi:hypothetical protein
MSMDASWIRKSPAAAGLALLLTAGGGRALAAEDPAGGFIHGSVHLRGGKVYAGPLRWDTEEAFWDDLFNATKTELRELERHGGDRRRRKTIKVFGVTVGYAWHSEEGSRQFVARFGDLRQLRVASGDKVEVTTRDGVAHRLGGGSNDVGAAIVVEDRELGQVKLDWQRIERVDFGPAPAGTRPPGSRLHGKVAVRGGTFEGYIQWDSQECLDLDRLDGESEDGEMSIEFGRIRAIEKHDDSGAWVELKDGRRLLLEGTNDVNDSIRGILVEDQRFGRVKLSWAAFERAQFSDAGPSGRAYGEFPEPRPLHGALTDQKGVRHAGRIVFDLDERASWEMLNGSRDGVEYDIPFALIRAIEPQRGEASRVILRSGAELVLGDSQDVSESNAGVLVLGARDSETYVPWTEVRRIDFD